MSLKPSIKNLLPSAGMIFMLLALSLVSCNDTKDINKTVLTVGTIHNYHANSDYSYNKILDILETYKPDLICVEIRPEIFRKNIYLTEMMIATAYGDLNKIPVVPVDWYDIANNDRLIRDSLSRVEKYIRLEKINDSLQKNSSILKSFYAKYGETPYKNDTLGADFWNGEDYNNSVRESYRISLANFGDSPFNLHYITRNRNMLHYIKEGIQKNNANKIIILTGAEHKSFFDDSLSKSCNVISLETIKPLVKADYNKFIAQMNPRLYFSSSDSAKKDEYYMGLTLPYFHGMRMDFDISYINLKNLPQIDMILKNWEAAAPNSVNLLYDRTWYYFLNKEYDNSIKYANLYLGTCNFGKTNFKDWGALRILGFCYDLKNMHDKAIPFYRKARESLSKTMPANVIEMLLSDYENKPYKRP